MLATGTGSIRKDGLGNYIGGIIIPESEKTDTGSHFGQRENFNILKQAKKDLGLTTAQVDRLFFFKGWSRITSTPYGSVTIETGWPDNFERAYVGAKTQQGRILVAIRRVEFFIRTKGTDKGKI